MAITAAILLVVPTIWADLAGLAVMAALIAFQLAKARDPAPAPASVGAAAGDRRGEPRL